MDAEIHALADSGVIPSLWPDFFLFLQKQSGSNDFTRQAYEGYPF